MPTLAELLDPAARARLAALARPSVQDLAESARAAVTESQGSDRVAWCAVALALKASESPGEARGVLEEMLEPGRIRALALGCLAVLVDTVR
jgi:hypothetical protein